MPRMAGLCVPGVCLSHAFCLEVGDRESSEAVCQAVSARPRSFLILIAGRISVLAVGSQRDETGGNCSMFVDCEGCLLKL